MCYSNSWVVHPPEGRRPKSGSDTRREWVRQGYYTPAVARQPVPPSPFIYNVYSGRRPKSGSDTRRKWVRQGYYTPAVARQPVPPSPFIYNVYSGTVHRLGVVYPQKVGDQHLAVTRNVSGSGSILYPQPPLGNLPHPLHSYLTYTLSRGCSPPEGRRPKSGSDTRRKWVRQGYYTPAVARQPVPPSPFIYNVYSGTLHSLGVVHPQRSATNIWQ
ncbi:hypothetical protein J6590_067182 [Homalodisca vitripennis]|nr:hypothetical protein J6590_067182 [Homalodisca vitripennis]